MAEQALPAQIGRYQVIRLIGEGGMGRVFAARDPRLDRVVALKQVAPGAEGGAQTLLAEALAMARLSHPNVVAVHDAGLEDGQAFVAMELVEGVTLRAWQGEAGRSWREILRAYVEAGRGLAAAHKAGITHRDFKPDNVLVSPDGRVRVTDFGLARPTAVSSADGSGGARATPGTPVPGAERPDGARATPGTPVPGADSPSGARAIESAPGTPAPGTDGSGSARAINSVSDTPVPGANSPGGARAIDSAPGTPARISFTPGGARSAQPSILMGTPRYMAPEQLAGARADPRSDQYAFCVSLSEALFDVIPRPSTAYARSDSPKTARLETARPEPQPPPAPTSSLVPGRRAAPIRATLERGLSAAAEERYPSMESLLLALEQAAASSRAWVPAAAAAALLAAVAVPLIVSRARVCADEPSAVNDVWSPEARAAVERSLAGPSREPARTHVLRALEAQAYEWAAMAREACEATRVRHQQSAEALDLRMACLHQRLGELSAVSQALVAGVKGDAEAIDLADSLSELQPCADPGTLAALAPPPSDPAAVTEIGRIRRELANVRAEQHAGKYAGAIAHAQTLSEAASKTGYRPVEAEALLELGRSRNRLGDSDGAERALLDAVVAAEAGRHLRLKAEALIALVNLSPFIRDPQRAREWDKQAVAVIEALGGDRLLVAKRHVAACELELADGRFEAAEVHAREAVSLLETELGAEHLDTQQAVRGLAQALLRGGQPLKAVALLRQQQDLRARIFGADNPERWAPVLVLVRALISAGYFQEALAEARAVREEIRGKVPDTASLPFTLDARIAFALHALGHQREALELARQQVQRGRENSAQPRAMMTALNTRAVVLGMTGRFDEAAADFRAEVELMDKLGGDLGTDRGNKAQIEANLGLQEIWSGKTEEGLRRVRAALEQRLEQLGPTHPDLRFMYVDIAEGELLGGHPERALEPARTALELTRAAAGPDSPTTSLAQVQLAEALIGIGRPAEAEPLVRKALANWAEHPGLPDHAARAHFVLARSLALSSPAEALQEAEQARQIYAGLESFRRVHAAGVEAWVARLRASKRIRGPESR